MNPPSDNGAGAMSARLARLTPQQRELLQRQLAARGTGNDDAPPATTPIVRRAERGQPQPLSPAQQRMWFFERLQPGTAAYHVYAYYRLDGVLDGDALQRAFAQVVNRHDALRTGFAEVDGQPRQTVVAPGEFTMERIDLSALAPTEREAQVQRLADIDADRPFDLARPPLLRATLLHLEPRRHVLLVVVHHIVSDAWSMGVLVDEVSRLYTAFSTGADASLPELPLQFADAVLWQQEPTQAGRIETQTGFWQRALSGTTGLLDLPTDYPRASTPLGRGGRVPMQLPQSLLTDVGDLARREGATRFMALLAVFQALLARHSGQDDIVVGSPVANRRAPALEPLIGLFVNTIALRADLGSDPTFRQLLARTRAHCLDALDHAEVPLERVIDALDIERAPGRTPLFQAMFVLQNTGAAPPSLPGVIVSWIQPALRVARLELTLSLEETTDGLEGTFDYDADLFEAATVARMARQFEVLLRGVLADPDQPLSQVPLLDDDDRRDLLRLGDGNREGADRDGPDPRAAADDSLFAMFAAQAARTPQAVALVEPGGTLRYDQLLRRAYGLAGELRALGVGPESRVGVLTDRSIEAIVAILGVLAAGGAYVPLDPAHPDERLAFLLDDCAAQALVAPPAWLARAQALHVPVPLLRSDAGADAARGIEDAHASGATHAAYVIYTSGSTGNPKGVVIENRGAVNLVRGFIARHDFRDQRLLMIPPLVFDASVGDVFPILATGSTLVLHPTPTELGPSELERFCAEHAVGAIDAPAALWRRWSEGWAAMNRTGPLLPQLRLMMIGGESVPIDLVRRFAGLTGGRVALCNHYGPTEASVCATMLATCDAAELAGPDLPIGTPLPGVRIYVLDHHLALAPRGVVGELCIGGVGIAREYLGLPDASAASFLPDPFVEDVGARLYRTGDLARWNHDGTLQFLGRRDNQVKLRGVRIELGEIETALEAHPQVHAAASLVREDRPGDRRLVAYVVCAQDGPDAAQLRDHLAQRLPEALLPAAYVRLDAMPLTRNGKVDRRALPVPDATHDRARTLRAPGTDTEHAVLAVWRDVLGRADLGVDDDFFAVGGDSLLTLPLVFKLHAALGVDVPLPSVFATPTIAGLARTIDQLRSGAPVAAFDLSGEVRLPDDIDPRHARLPATSRATPRSVLVTGATGFLGAYLVRELLDTTDAEVLCLVRADTVTDGLRRVRANLEGYGQWRDGDEARLVPVPGDLSAPLLGLGGEGFDALAQRTEAIFHNGGQVNFLAPYEHLRAANVDGTREVLRLATHTRVKPVHLVSTLGVYLTDRHLGTTVRESDPPPHADDQQGGYNQSKWVGEQLALLARARGLPVAIYRPARITGDSRSGAGNVGDYFNAWIKGCVQLGLAPRLSDESFDMAPVDYVGRAIVRLALGAGDANGNFHFLNPHRLPVPAAIEALDEAGYRVREVPYPRWRDALLAVTTASRDNALAPFAGLFPEHYDPTEPAFDCTATADLVAATGLTCPPADRALFSVYLRFLRERGALPALSEVEA
ncbi:non-ribosomal peptide synthetase [Montanilutibacter psychrotolerans]|uniref:Amino acid adenylation domain-containing protein n=1 Tax=Montanilutibacter psychrotolerans TaxID=1327343 RepID=A0A3M8SNT6_9GAMM|nr:non-ribosomal peptide synthetase [Lysobacter psychrotolerans]RNF82345.1 amino acid adenylation domain-containing protein [Lysobacter psychrotolerans]